MSGLVNQTAAYTAGGVVPNRMGNAHPSLFPYETMPTADRDMIITAGNNRQFQSLCEVLGIPEVADDERFATNADRTRNREELRPLLLEQLAKWSADDLFVALNKAGVPCGPINDIGEGVELAESLGLGPRVEVGEGDRAVTVVRNPISFSDADVRYRLPPPSSASTPTRSRNGCGAPSNRSRGDDRRGTPTYRTGIGTSTADEITLLGQDLAHDLIGKITFGDLAFRLVAKRQPTPQELTMFEAVLVSLADHGFTPTAIAARLTYTSAPESLQGALAAGLLGGGSRFLGVTEDAARFLSDGLAEQESVPEHAAGWDELAAGLVRRTKAAGRFVPGLGHPVHRVEDPRTPVLFELARQQGTFGPHLELFAAIGRVHPQVLGRTLPLNGAGTCGAVLADLDLPVSVMRGFALLARARASWGTSPRRRRTRSAWRSTSASTGTSTTDHLGASAPRPVRTPFAVSARWYDDRQSDTLARHRGYKGVAR